MHRPPDTDSRNERWRTELLDAVVEGRLAAADHRDLVHRHDTATRPARRLAVRAEIEVLLRCLAVGLEVRSEFRIEGGRPIDLLVTLPEDRFAVHVKRLPVVLDAAVPVPTAFGSLSDVPRPYVVGIRWFDPEPPSADVVEEVRRFLISARMRDRLPIRRDGRDLGLVEIRAPVERVDGNVRIVPMTAETMATVERAGRLLRRAYRQFVPGLENVIVLVGATGDGADLVDRAVLGGHIERWDRLPVVGERVAHGRDDGGLWNGRRYERSRLVGWCPLDGPAGVVWQRDVSDPPEAPIVDALRRALASAAA